MNRSNLKAFSTAISNAALSRKTALQYEVAVTFAVHLDCKQAKRLTRAMMCEIYHDVGYKCAVPGELDWKSINRRITAALALFDFMGAAEIASWIDGKSRMEIVNAIIVKLEPLKLKSTNEILACCDKVGKAARGPRQEPEGTRKIELEHLHIVIPPNVTRGELVSAAIEMMRLAEQMVAQETEDAATPNGQSHNEVVEKDEAVHA